MVPQDDCTEEPRQDTSAREYLRRADEAVQRGELGQSAHLYLAAFDAAQSDDKLEEDYINGLRKAWRTAIELKDTSLAEHVYSLLEPYSTPQDEADHARHMQMLAQDALEGFGMATDDAHGLAEMLAEGSKNVDRVMRVVGMRDNHAEEDEAERDSLDSEKGFADLVGFDEAIADMQKRGIGVDHAENYEAFLTMMRVRHGIKSAPLVNTLVVRAPSLDDANIFAVATCIELGLPAVRMRVESNIIGLPTLSIAASKQIRNAQHVVTNGFEGPGVLVLENIDEWDVPEFMTPDGTPVPLYMRLTRGALQAVTFIRNAVEDPEVQVLASASLGSEIDPFFMDLLFPIEYFDIDFPTPEERGALWKHARIAHPSLGMLNYNELVELTGGMSRTDIYSAGTEAVEAAWREGIRERRYIPVTRSNLLDKIAQYQSPDTVEYLALEDALADSMGNQFVNLESTVDQWRKDVGLDKR